MHRHRPTRGRVPQPTIVVLANVGEPYAAFLPQIINPNSGNLLAPCAGVSGDERQSKERVANDNTAQHKPAATVLAPLPDRRGEIATHLVGPKRQPLVAGADPVPFAQDG